MECAQPECNAALSTEHSSPTALIPPSHLLQSTKYLPDLTSPSIHLRVFPNGLRVLSTAFYDDEGFSQRVVAHLYETEAQSALDIAQKEGVSLLLVQQLLRSVELSRGDILRDEDGRGNVLWYRNRFEELVAA